MNSSFRLKVRRSHEALESQAICLTCAARPPTCECSSITTTWLEPGKEARDPLGVERLERVDGDDGRGSAPRFELVGDLEGHLHDRAVGKNADVVALA